MTETATRARTTVHPALGVVMVVVSGVLFAVNGTVSKLILEAGVDASVGSVGDAYDNALAESQIGLYKTELIRRQGPWRNVDEVELATLEWVTWFNTGRLHTALGDLPPTEFEAAFYAAQHTHPDRVGIQ